MRTASLTACVVLVLATFLAAQEPAVPGGLRREQSLPARQPYVAQDALRLCRPVDGFWVDLGAGKGQVAIPLAQASGNAVVMVDPDAEALTEGLAQARKHGLENRLSAVVSVAEKLPFPDNSVDFVVSRGSIFFWTDPVAGLQEVLRVLRPGAKAYIGGGAGRDYPRDATAELVAGRLARLEGPEAERWRQFVALRRPEQMREWAESAGLPRFEVLGRGAVSADDPRVGQGVWLLMEKPAAP